MLAEFWKAFTATAHEAANVKPVILKQELQVDSRLIHYWHPTQEQILTIPVSPPDRNHVLSNIESLSRLVTHLVNSGEFGDAVLWVGAHAITVSLDDDGTNTNDARRHKVTMPLVKTPLWTLLETLALKPLLDQAAAIRLLRQELQRFDVGSKALSAIRNLKLRRTENVEAEQQPGNQRMSRSIQQEAAGAGGLPESIALHAMPYRGVSEERPVATNEPETQFPGYPLLIWLDVDFDKVGIRFEPDAAAMAEAIENEQRRLVTLLRDEFRECDHIHVFAGNP